MHIYILLTVFHIILIHIYCMNEFNIYYLYYIYVHTHIFTNTHICIHKYLNMYVYTMCLHFFSIIYRERESQTGDLGPLPRTDQRLFRGPSPHLPLLHFQVVEFADPGRLVA